MSKVPTRPGFENLPRRWIAERTFARISHNRRMTKDYEGLCSTREALIHASMTRLMVRRLVRALGLLRETGTTDIPKTATLNSFSPSSCSEAQ